MNIERKIKLKPLIWFESTAFSIMRDVTEFWKGSKAGLHSFHIRWTFVFKFMFQLLHGNKKDFCHVNFAVTFFCFTFGSCPMDIRFMISLVYIRFT